MPLFVLLSLIVAFAGLVLTINGLILAFSASIVLGLIVLVVEPLPFIIGLVHFVTNVDLAAAVMQHFQ